MPANESKGSKKTMPVHTQKKKEHCEEAETLINYSREEFKKTAKD